MIFACDNAPKKNNPDVLFTTPASAVLNNLPPMAEFPLPTNIMAPPIDITALSVNIIVPLINVIAPTNVTALFTNVMVPPITVTALPINVAAPPTNIIGIL